MPYPSGAKCPLIAAFLSPGGGSKGTPTLTWQSEQDTQLLMGTA